jgi:hypothetical protein
MSDNTAFGVTPLTSNTGPALPAACLDRFATPGHVLYDETNI